MPVFRRHPHRRKQSTRLLPPFFACVSLLLLLAALPAPIRAQPEAAATPVTEPAMEPAGIAADDDTGSTSQSLWESPVVNASVIGCPAGFDASSTDLATYQALCVEAVGVVEFTLIEIASGLSTASTSGGTPNDVQFIYLDIVDDYTAPDAGEGYPALLQVTMPAGYDEARVSCTYSDVEGANWGPTFVPVYGTTSIDVEVDAADVLTCAWYLVPPATPSVDDATGTVRLLKMYCPAGTERSDEEFAMRVACAEAGDPVTFEVSDDAGADVPVTTTPADMATLPGEAPPQIAEVSGLAFGPVWIAEVIPAGYGAPLVFCSDSLERGSFVPVALLDGGNAVVTELRAEADVPLTCHFYNLLDDGGTSTGDGGDVHLSKYTCPPGYTPIDDSYLMSEQCRMEIDPVTFTILGPDGVTQTVDATAGVPQNATFTDVPFGNIDISEVLPDATSEFRLFCTDTPADGPGAYEPATMVDADTNRWNHRADAEIDLSCVAFNFQNDSENTITVNKYICPPGVNIEEDILLEVCDLGGDGTMFEMVDALGSHPAAVVDGMVQWTGVLIGMEGELQIIEDIPAGFGDPLVTCDGIRMDATNGFVVPQPGDDVPFAVTCDWFNIMPDDSSLVLIKHTCPAGYTLDAAGADPLVDCPTLTDGVTFHIAGPDTDRTAITGDDGTGQVTFGELGAGNYAITETVPEGTALSFVSECVGTAIGSVRPFPLATGPVLKLAVAGGESITCHWFNVPTPEGATLTLQKFTCSTETFVSTVDCQVYEDGQAFDLLVWNGDDWVYVDSMTTDGHGLATFSPIDPGQYWVDEVDGDWCHLTSERLSDDGNWLEVDASSPTVVFVYNCDGEPGKPGKTPTKYPNTGVPPMERAPDDAGAAITVATLAGLLGASFSRRVALLGVPSVAVGVAVASARAQDQVIEPSDGTPEGTPTSLCLPATPGVEAEDGCQRGPIPASIRIESISVDNPIEILETVGGVMQQPTDEVHVAWYKETARLGETGNLLLAGHVNWWGVPEAVFFNLGTLREGDLIELLDEDETVFTYAVEWVQQESNLEPPREEVLGMTNYEAITLMTCSGQWNSEISEYDARTVARARRVINTGSASNLEMR